MLELAHKVEDMAVYWQLQKARLFKALDEGFRLSVIALV